MLKRAFAKNSNLPLTAEQEAEAQRLAETLAAKTKEDLLQITRLLVSKQDHEFWERRSSRSGTWSTRSAPRPSRPLSTSGKKGVPRVEHDLSRTAATRHAAWGGAAKTCVLAGLAASATSLLSLQELRPGTLPLGPEAAHDRPASDAGRARGGVSDGHPRELRPSGGADVAQADRHPTERINRGADHGGGRDVSARTTRAGRAAGRGRTRTTGMSTPRVSVVPM